VTWEYKVVRLSGADSTATWEQEAALHSSQLTSIALEGWELLAAGAPWPWVCFRRAVPLDDDPRINSEDLRQTEVQDSRGPKGLNGIPGSR
jgi:hypothetical protein